MLRQQRVSADALAPPCTNVPVPFMVPPVTVAPGVFLDRNRLTGHHRLVHRRHAFDDDAVHRDTFARTDAKPIAHVHVLERDIVFGAVGLDSSGRLRRETEQTANRRARAAARAQLQHLPEQHEHDDDRGRLEIDRDLAVDAKRGRKQPRRDRREHAVGDTPLRRPSR